METEILKIFNSSIDVKTRTLNDTHIVASITKVVDLLTLVFKRGGAVYFCGNGGSAADAQHLAAEFSGRFYIDRVALRSEALHCNTSYLTAVANDYSYDEVYSRLIKGLARNGDVLIGLSTSGNSKNVINAFQTATSIGVTTISFTGLSGYLSSISDYSICVPSSDTPRIQEAHMLIGHIICELVERKVFQEQRSTN
jgi:D-sedoheptulose 7-phosphate isomerase